MVGDRLSITPRHPTDSGEQDQAQTDLCPHDTSSVARDIAASNDFCLNNRVLVFDLAAGLSDGMAALLVFGQPNLTTGGGGTTASKFLSPSAVTLDVSGQRMFVTDLNNHRVLVFE